MFLFFARQGLPSGIKSLILTFSFTTVLLNFFHFFHFKSTLNVPRNYTRSSLDNKVLITLCSTAIIPFKYSSICCLKVTVNKYLKVALQLYFSFKCIQCKLTLCVCSSLEKYTLVLKTTFLVFQFNYQKNIQPPITQKYKTLINLKFLIRPN